MPDDAVAGEPPPPTAEEYAWADTVLHLLPQSTPAGWDPTVTVEPGEIRVDDVDVMLDNPNCKVWYANVVSKYARVLAYSQNEVLLHADERTLRTDDTRKGHPTTLKLPLPDGDGWNVIAEAGRYTCRIVAYRLPRLVEEDAHVPA